MKKYVWLDTNNWKFSDSWDENDIDDETIKLATEKGWKLIEFTCLNDSDFVFTTHMKLR
jgi:hypothetical protein